MELYEYLIHLTQVYLLCLLSRHSLNYTKTLLNVGVQSVSCQLYETVGKRQLFLLVTDSHNV